MNRVLDICRFIINYSNGQGYDISNLKLQKLLYFVQAYFLISVHELCFAEGIEAWDFGPVVPEAYHEYKRYGNMDIPPVTSYFERERNHELTKHDFDEECIAPNNRRRIRDVVDNFAEYTASELVELTHGQSPWKDAYVPGENRLINRESIERYFA